MSGRLIVYTHRVCCVQNYSTDQVSVASPHRRVNVGQGERLILRELALVGNAIRLLEPAESHKGQQLACRCTRSYMHAPPLCEQLCSKILSEWLGVKVITSIDYVAGVPGGMKASSVWLYLTCCGSIRICTRKSPIVTTYRVREPSLQAHASITPS